MGLCKHKYLLQLQWEFTACPGGCLSVEVSGLAAGHERFVSCMLVSVAVHVWSCPCVWPYSGGMQAACSCSCMCSLQGHNGYSKFRGQSEIESV